MYLRKGRESHTHLHQTCKNRNKNQCTDKQNICIKL